MAAHDLMARYFGNLVDPSLRGDRKITEQGWTRRGHPFENTSVVNARRVCEASHHMIESGLLEEAENELCAFEGICSKIRSGEGFQLIRDLAAVIDQLQSQGTSISCGGPLQVAAT
jgi:hypothetical protein